MVTTAQAIDQFSDWRWRLNNLYSITDKDGNHIPFRLNWAQETLFNDMHYLNLILKARQLGFTTFIQLFMLDQCVFFPTINAGTIAHTREDAEAFFTQKVRYPYDNLPEGIKDVNPAILDSARHLSFKNKSSLRVGTSLRSGTFQYLHVSEFGKICARFPDKAREIKTGAFNTVHAGQVIWVESTAEGQEGDFFRMCEDAQTLQRRGEPLTELDFKFFFFPWWKHPQYRLDAHVSITKEYEDYFDELHDEHGIFLDDQQRAWYIKKAAQQQDDMKREFPSTPEEAFETSVEGAYYGRLMAKAEGEKRICDLPHEVDHAVETWWDLGMNDLMTIAWVQRIGPWFNVIDSYENSGEGLAHYAGVLQEKQRERNLVYSHHYWPHDGNTRILDEEGRKRTEVMASLGYKVEVVRRALLSTGIEAVRNLVPKMRFDESRCDKLIRGMKNYRKEWDEERAAFKDKPVHNWASHWADMVRTGAMCTPPKDQRRQPIEYPEGVYV